MTLLKAAQLTAQSSAQVVRDYHDELLYLCAYPSDRGVMCVAQRELLRVAMHVRRRPARELSSGESSLENSGVAGTPVTTTFSLDLLHWLTARAGRRIELDWNDEAAVAALDELLPALVLSAEADGLLTDRLTTREWLRRARGQSARSDLAWVLRQFDRVHASDWMRDRLFDSLNLSVRWMLDAPASRTFNRFPPRSTYYQAGDLMRDVRPDDILRTPLPSVRRMPTQEATRLIDVARNTLAARQRETDPVTYANPREITLCRLERGVDVALFGMLPARRLPIESFFGFIAARNRVPVAYGGGWMFFDRCEIGVNLFEEFRGGESAYIFAQVMRVYWQHYGARRFVVDPFQFGADNTEAIQSGAFWFYHRLGFRPVDAQLKSLAEREHARITGRPGERTPAALLRRLAGAKLVREAPLGSGVGESSPAPDLIELGLAVTSRIAREFDGDRDVAERSCAAHVARRLGGGLQADWSPDERCWFARLAPLAALIADLVQWSALDKRELLDTLRAKGGVRERDYVRRLSRNARFRAALYAATQTENRSRQ